METWRGFGEELVVGELLRAVDVGGRGSLERIETIDLDIWRVLCFERSIEDDLRC